MLWVGNLDHKSMDVSCITEIQGRGDMVLSDITNTDASLLSRHRACALNGSDYDALEVILQSSN